MLRRAIFLLFLLTAYIFAAGGGSKPVLDRLLTDSPWAVRTDASMDDPAEAGQASVPVAPPAGVGQPTPGGRPSQGPSTDRWDGGVTRNRRGHLATIPVLVRWDSAAVMRQALDRQQAAGAKELAAEAADNFVITVIGLLPATLVSGPATLQAKSSSDDTAAPKTTEDTLEWFMTNSRLLVKGEAAMQPQNVKIDPGTGVLHLLFKRNDALAQRKRDVLFVTRYGSMNVQTRFHTKDMVIDGQLDL